MPIELRAVSEEYNKLFAKIQATPKDSPEIKKLWKQEQKLWKKSTQLLKQNILWVSKRRRKFWKIIDDISCD
jgi:CHASE3 domain sensor protein